jgi:hypothetical protein
VPSLVVSAPPWDRKIRPFERTSGHSNSSSATLGMTMPVLALVPAELKSRR